MTSNCRFFRNQHTGEIVLSRVKLCQSYWCHLQGLQFRRSLPADEGLLFVTSSESVVATSIHMLNMFFSISVIWMDKDGYVVDKQLAKPWRLAYVPSKPAQYYLEANPEVLEFVKVGDQFRFDEVSKK